MNLTSKIEIKNLLKKYGSTPDKRLGQHFILSKKALTSMIGAAEIKKDETVIEVGPGLGTLTRELAAIGAKIIAIEKDPIMIEILKETLSEYKNVQIIQADARDSTGVRLRWKSGKVVDKSKYKIAANLPYNMATFLIRQWLELENLPALPAACLPARQGRQGRQVRPELMVLMIQKEVAQRIVAKPPRANLLGISVQFYANAEIIDYVKKESFWPRPKVDAAIIKIVPKNLPAQAGSPPQKTRNAFFAVLKAGFSQPRKQLVGNLTKKLKISKENLILIFKNLDISERARAENLSLEQWQNLASKLIHN